MHRVSLYPYHLSQVTYNLAEKLAVLPALLGQGHHPTGLDCSAAGEELFEHARPYWREPHDSVWTQEKKPVERLGQWDSVRNLVER